MNYHPDIAILLDYANGKLAPAISIAVGLHQSQCKTCQQKVADLETIGGDTMAAVNAPIKLSTAESFEKLFSLVSDQEQTETSDQLSDLAVAKDDQAILNQLANRDYASFQWQRLTPKISKAVVPLKQGQHQVQLLKFSANAKIPKHTHNGKEITLVLEGDFSDHLDNYPRGEFIVQDQKMEHQPIAGADGCICLAITNAPLKFTGVFGSLLNWANR
jgi:putative transcriptional regulator